MLELRLLNDEDISLVEVWLNKEHVKKWYEIPHLGVSINDWLYELKERDGEFKWLTHSSYCGRGARLDYANTIDVRTAGRRILEHCQ